MAKTEYQRLTRPSSRSSFALAAVSRASLWLGADHLLSIETNGYTESYKRFYFRDIQAFIVQKTPLVNVTNVGLTVLSLLFLVPALVADDAVAKGVLASIGGIFALILIISLLRGPTCRCYLRTAVQIEELPSLNRVRRAQKVFARVRPLIAAAQGGELSPEMIIDQMQGPFPRPAAASPTAPDDPNIPPRLESPAAP